MKSRIVLGTMAVIIIGLLRLIADQHDAQREYERKTMEILRNLQITPRPDPSTPGNWFCAECGTELNDEGVCEHCDDVIDGY